MNYGAVWADTATNWAEINEICGISYADRIIGGTKAELGQFPWIAHVGIVREYFESTHGNSAWVMTEKNGSVQDLFFHVSINTFKVVWWENKFTIGKVVYFETKAT